MLSIQVREDCFADGQPRGLSFSYETFTGEQAVRPHLQETALDVWSRSLVDWIDSESLGLFCPGFADELVIVSRVVATGPPSRCTTLSAVVVFATDFRGIELYAKAITQKAREADAAKASGIVPRRTRFAPKALIWRAPKRSVTAPIDGNDGNDTSAPIIPVTPSSTHERV